MRAPSWLRDTIARRFAITIMLAVLATVALNGAFVAVGGVWARPSAEEAGLRERAAILIRIIGAGPPESRQTLASAASTETVQIDWYPASSPVAAALEHASNVKDAAPEFGDLLRTASQRAVIFRSDNPITTVPGFRHLQPRSPDTYFLAARYDDGSWLILFTLKRIWGVGRPIRIGIGLIFLVLSVSIVSLIAAHQLSRPIERLVEAAHLFGTDHQAPAVAETGPRELRGVFRAFNTMRAQIHKYVSDRTAMLAAISHDLRTPLTRIRLRAEFIDDPEQQTKLFRDVDEMQMMVDGALAFFRDGGEIETTTLLDLSGLLRTIADEYADRGVDVDYVGPAHTVYRGRPFALKRAFTNLIDNAIKYGSPPTIELAHQPQTIAVAIRDNGPGIPQTALDHVFDPFYRVDESRNRSTGGVGLGLTAARAIVRAHGGDIVLRNRTSGGLEAQVTLPESA